ncbi:MAG: SpoIID/LytB domain-containing protein [Gemmatimonadota bacterium]
MRRSVPLLLGLGLVLVGCTVAGPRPGDRPAPEVEGPSAEPSVRVGLVVDAGSVELDGTDRLELVDAAGRVRADGPGPWTVTAADGEVEARGPDGAIRVGGTLVARPVSGRVRMDGKSYRGAVLLRPSASGITAVNLLELEMYLLGVVPLEIGAGRPPEELAAVKAQAIAARTYAVRHMGRREKLGFDFYGSVLDQVYGGLDAEDPVSSRAVRETRGEVLVHDDEPIEAFYHSTCGGRTAALEEVWPGEPRPYLRSVSDRRPDGGWYCESSNRFRWTERWDDEALRATLTLALRSRGHSGTVTAVEAVDVTDRTESGRAAEVRIRTNMGDELVHGDSIRRVLRPEPGRILNSTAIRVETHGGPGTGLTVEGAGWGHGIGMCQIGAVGRARAGQTYREILVTYYPGTRIARLY